MEMSLLFSIYFSVLRDFSGFSIVSCSFTDQLGQIILEFIGSLDFPHRFLKCFSQFHHILTVYY